MKQEEDVQILSLERRLTQQDLFGGREKKEEIDESREPKTNESRREPASDESKEPVIFFKLSHTGEPSVYYGEGRIFCFIFYSVNSLAEQ